VEINALWFNALKLMEEWAGDHDDRAAVYRDRAEQVRRTFNDRFWFAEGGYLYDVIDGEDGRDDPACRPNQLLAVSLEHPVLDPSRWARVLDVAREKLLTPAGLRSLSPDSGDFKAKYYGDLRTRDAAYHQGTVWAWLIGPFIDAWLKVHPEDCAGARRLLDGLVAELDFACVGSISEIFDAEIRASSQPFSL
jgi:predicted glycogen debranching enzyme